MKHESLKNTFRTGAMSLYFVRTLVLKTLPLGLFSLTYSGREGFDNYTLAIKDLDTVLAVASCDPPCS